MTTDGGNITSGPEELATTLEQVEDLRRTTRAVVHPAWFPLVLFGAFGLASAPFCTIGEGLGVGLFWAVAGPVGGVITARYYRNRALATGAGMRGGPYWAVAAGIFIAAFVAGSSSSSRVQSAGPMVAVALGYLMFARLERNWTIGAVAGLLAAVALAVGIADIGHSCVLLSLTFGVAFTVTGLVLRRETVPEDSHPSQRLDDVVHQRVRLGILAVLAEADVADFGFVKDALSLTDGNLSRHLQVLEEAGFVKTTKAFEGRRPRTWIAATRAGRAAFASELAALRELIAGVDRSSTGNGDG